MQLSPRQKPANTKTTELITYPIKEQKLQQMFTMDFLHSRHIYYTYITKAKEINQKRFSTCNRFPSNSAFNGKAGEQIQSPSLEVVTTKCCSYQMHIFFTGKKNACWGSSKKLRRA